MKTWTLPLPPGTNNLYRNVTTKDRARMAAEGRRLPGRVRTMTYQAWSREAGLMLMTQGARRITLGYVRVSIVLSVPKEGQRIDLDAIKAIPDLLVEHGLIEDDKRMVGMTLTWRKGPRGAEVEIYPANSPWESRDA